MSPFSASNILASSTVAGTLTTYAKPFPIPKIHKLTIKKEVDRLIKIGVLKKINAPTFIIPKKNNTVRFISDFRELNKRIKTKPFPIPKHSRFIT